MWQLLQPHAAMMQQMLDFSVDIVELKPAEQGQTKP